VEVINHQPQNKSAQQTQAQDIIEPISRDASYSVLYQQDGVFLATIKEEGEGLVLDHHATAYDLSRLGIQGLNMDSLKAALRRGTANQKIAEPQEQQTADSDVYVEVSSDGMTAALTLFPPVLSGQTKSPDEVLALIREKWKVVFGINEELARAAVLSRSYRRPHVFAYGQPPQKGKDGALIFHFSTNHSIAPKILEDGSADYKNLNLFESVAEGADVVSSVPPEEGIPGYDVTGKELPAQKGKEYRLPKGKNVRLSEDGRSLQAAKSGRVDYINGRVEISDVFKISGDVDMGVGNVSFEGDIVVAGNVISGLKLEASGMIEVHGYVEGAELIAGKDIVLRNGMQGMSQGRLEAGGNILARFIERATVSAKGDVMADYIVQCLVTACGSVTLKGKWGKLLGGVVRAGKEVTAQIIGAPSSDRTQLELGVLPDERARYTKLDAEKGQIKAQLNRVNNILGVMPQADLPPEKQAVRQKLADAAAQLNDQYSAILIEIEELRQLLSTNSGARINVLKCIYPNVRIQIDSSVMTTSSLIEFATFRCRDGEVHFTACEVKK